MAEQVSKHCWATPKCGISFAEMYFKEVNRDIDYEFIIVRNPLSRIVSFYVNKVIYQGNPPWDYKDQYENETIIPHLSRGNTGMSFEQVVGEIQKINVKGADRHLKPQYLGVRGRSFDTVVHLENFAEEMKDVCETLDVDYDVVFHNTNKFPKTKEIDFYVGDKPTVWLRENGIPKDWRLFYNEDTLQTIGKKYIEDFQWLTEYEVGLD